MSLSHASAAKWSHAQRDWTCSFCWYSCGGLGNQYTEHDLGARVVDDSVFEGRGSRDKHSSSVYMQSNSEDSRHTNKCSHADWIECYIPQHHKENLSMHQENQLHTLIPSSRIHTSTPHLRTQKHVIERQPSTLLLLGSISPLLVFTCT